MKWNKHKAALSLTFDDGLTCQLEHAIPAMDRVGIKGTFFLPTDCPQYPLDVRGWIETSQNGHEIGSHSVTHRKAAKLSMTDSRMEAKISRRYLEELIQRPVTSFCYPYTDAPAGLQEQVSHYYKQARGGRVAREDKYIVAGDTVNLWNVPCHHISLRSFTDGEIVPWIQEAIKREAWLTLMFHGVGPDASQWDNVPLPQFTALLDGLREGQAKGLVWVAPFGTVADFYRGIK